ALAWRRGDARGAIALPPLLALALLSGHPQEGYYLAVALAAWGTWSLVRDLRQGRGRRVPTRLAAGLGVVLLTVGLTAVEWLPDARAGAWALRGARLSLREASRYHINPLNVVQLLTPRALGGPADYFGHENYWESVLAFGWAPLVLVALGLTHAPRR